MENIAIPILVVLVGGFLTIRYKEVCKKREKCDKEYSDFKSTFLNFIKCLEEPEISLNTMILSEFPIHNDARRKFIHNIKGSRLNRFNKKWAEYEEEYNQVKNLGVFGIAAAIAPSHEALINATHLDAEHWELARKKKIHRIITQLLKISKRNIWL